MSDTWLESLVTADAQSGYELAIKLSRMGVKYTQPSDEIRNKLRTRLRQKIRILRLLHAQSVKYSLK